MKYIKYSCAILLIAFIITYVSYNSLSEFNKKHIFSKIDRSTILKFFYEATIYNQLIKPAYTRREYIDVLYQMTQDISQVFDVLGIDYRIIGATLLGAIRHEGIIPWADYISIVISPESEKKFQTCGIPMLEKLEYLHLKQTNHYKIIAGEHLIDLHDDELYPVCDIFVAVQQDSYKIVYAAREYIIYDDQWDVIHEYKFGGLLLKGISKPELYLDNIYGKNWHKFAIRGHDNRTITARETSRLPFSLQDRDYQPILPSKPLVDNRETINLMATKIFCN